MRNIKDCFFKIEYGSALDGQTSGVGPGRVKTFLILQKLHAAGRDPRRGNHILLYRVWSQSGRNLGPR
jgi:hypothetical protein